MKLNNTIKFWFKNRIIFIFLLWILFGIFASTNPYINGIIATILFFGSLFCFISLFEERKANSSERLTWIKLCDIFGF